MTTKTDIISSITGKTGLAKKDVALTVDALFDAITNSLSDGEEVRIVGFGNFSVTQKPARTGRNPQTGETMQIAASTSPKFKPGKALKDAVNS